MPWAFLCITRTSLVSELRTEIAFNRSLQSLLRQEVAAEHLAFQQSLARKGRLTHLRVLRRRIPLMGSIWDDEERLRTQWAAGVSWCGFDVLPGWCFQACSTAYSFPIWDEDNSGLTTYLWDGLRIPTSFHGVFPFFFQTSPFQWIGLRQHLQEPMGFIPKFRLPVMAALGSHSRRTPTAFCGPLGFWAQPPVSTPQVGHEGARLGDVNAEFLWLFFWLANVGDLIPRIYKYNDLYITIHHHFLLLLSSAAPAGLQVLPAPLGKVPKKVVLRQQPPGRAVLLQGGAASCSKGVGAPWCPRFLKMMGSENDGMMLGKCFFLKSEDF